MVAFLTIFVKIHRKFEKIEIIVNLKLLRKIDGVFKESIVNAGLQYCSKWTSVALLVACVQTIPKEKV